MNQGASNEVNQETATKFCKFCGQKIAKDAVLCTHCGRQVEEIKQEATSTPNIVINNSNLNTNTNTNVNANVNGRSGRAKNKWVALLLCFFLGFFGAHKFYEGKVGMGILYIFTGGLFSIGVIIDFIAILCKPNPYYV
ncbi:MAG: TM2 domain-containing protein [Clostridia bacterium]|nr:TM2 domain-containing protein [Clostridia bacterium]